MSEEPTERERVLKGPAPMTSTLVDPGAIETLAEVLAGKLAERLPRLGAEDAWMTSAEAAEYLAIPISTLRKLTAAGSIPFSQDVAGGRCYFKRSELDRWREKMPRIDPKVHAEPIKWGHSEDKSGPATLQRPGPGPRR